MTTTSPENKRDTDPGADPAEATFRLRRHPEALAVVRLDPGADVPPWASATALLSVTATASETSLVCAAATVPATAASEGPFAAFEVAGPLDFAMTGVLHALLDPLAAASVSVFVLSTFDTDWVLVPADRAGDAARAWAGRGHIVVVPDLPPPLSEQATP